MKKRKYLVMSEKEKVFSMLAVTIIGVTLMLIIKKHLDYLEAQTPNYIQSNYSDYEIVIDEETGVNYIVFNEHKKGGMTVRVNADGTPYVSEVDR